MEDLQYVGFWSRFWATVVDTVLFMMIIYPIFYMIYGNAFLTKASDFTLINNLLNFIFPFVSVIILWKSKGATPGKMFIKAKIVDEDTLGEPSSKQLLLRYFAYIISMVPLFLGFFWNIWDKKKQTWHDKLAHTVVVQPKQEEKRKTAVSYVGIGVGVFAVVAFLFLLVLGVMLQKGYIPNGDLYTGKNLPTHVSATLIEKNIITSNDKIHFYQPESMFSFTDTGIVVTSKSILYFTTEKGETLLWNFPLDEVSKLTLDDMSFVLGISILTLNVYDMQGELVFEVGLTPKKINVKTVKKELLELWKNASEK